MEKEFMRNFGMIIPQGPFVPYKPKPISRWKKVVCFMIGHRWGFAGISYTGPSFPRKCKRCEVTKWFDKPTVRMRIAKWADVTLDKIWPAFCRIGVHRWRHHYGYSQFTIGGDGPIINQSVFKCSSCKKTKTVNVK